MFTDRAIYRPGQLVYFKGMVTRALDQIPEIQAGEEVVLSLRDANWQELWTKKMVTNAYGTFHGSFTAPEDMLNGRMTITVANRYHHNIRVEEYKRPKIQASLDTLRQAYALGDTVQLEGWVRSFSGLNLEDCTVRYKVEKRRYYWRYWLPRGGDATEQLIVAGVTKSDAQGKFVLEIPTSESPHNFHVYNYHVHCDVVDQTGEAVSATKTFRLSALPYTLSYDLPREAFVGELDSLLVTAANVEGQPLSVDYSVRLSKLIHPRTCLLYTSPSPRDQRGSRMPSSA